MHQFTNLYRSIIGLVSLNAINYLIIFFISIVIFRTVDKNFYGFYVLILSIFAFPDLLTAGLNQSIQRFFKEEICHDAKLGIIKGILVYKILIFLIFISLILIAFFLEFDKFLLKNAELVQEKLLIFLFIAGINFLLSIFLGIFESILNSADLFLRVTKIGLIRNAFYLVIVLCYSHFFNQYEIYLISSTILSVIVLLYYSSLLSSRVSEFRIKRVLKTRFSADIAKEYIIPYSFPLTISSLLTYSKNHLPILFLGKYFDLTEVSIFSIIKTLFKALHSVAGSFFDPMLAYFVKMKKNKLELRKKLNTIIYSTFIFRALIALFLFFVSDLFFQIYKINIHAQNSFVFDTLAFEFILAGILSVFTLRLKLNENTKKILFSNWIRFFIEVPLIMFLIPKYGIMGSALTLLISRYFESITSFLLLIHHRILIGSGILLILFLPVIIFIIFELASL